MTERDLNSEEKLQLTGDIKLSILTGLLFSVAIMIFFGLVIGVMVFIGKPSDGFKTRILYIIGISFLPLLAVLWTNILKYIDLKKGKKLIIETDSYEVISKKDTAYILTRGEKKQKIEIDKALVPYINPTQSLTMGISKLGRSLLFISHDSDNLLDKLDNHENK